MLKFNNTNIYARFATMLNTRHAMQILTMSSYGQPQHGYVVVAAKDNSKYGSYVMRISDIQDEMDVIDVFCPERQKLFPVLRDMGEIDEDWPDCVEGMAVKGDCCVWAMGLCRHTHQGIERLVEEMNQTLGLKTIWLDKAMIGRSF